jgi:outer membrane protein OmpA-like peptidoglycan-associated protein
VASLCLLSASPWSWAAADAAIEGATRVPLIPGLTLNGAASERQGDYESVLTVEAIDAAGTVHLTIAAQLPDPAGGTPRAVSFTRDVRSLDLKNGRTYKYLFSDGADEYPGSTAMGTSAGVIADLRALGKTTVTLDGQPGGLGGMLAGVLGSLAGSEEKSLAMGYLTGTGALHAVEPKPVPYSMIENNVVISLPAWHLKGVFGSGGAQTSVEWYILDDPANALTLRFVFGKEQLEIVRISFPVENAAKTLERTLTDTRRAVVYGIYFDFNSDTLKPNSDSVLRTIAEMMNHHRDWILNIEGHTDNIGGDVKNQDLSARRAAAVKAALIERGLPGGRLNTAGFGVSAPLDTNATLAGRARNRRVELTRQ